MFCPETNGLTCTTCAGGCLIQDRCFMLSPLKHAPASNKTCKKDNEHGQFCAVEKADICSSCYRGCIIGGVCHTIESATSQAFDKSTCDTYEGEFCSEWDRLIANQTQPKSKAISVGSCYAFIPWLLLNVIT